jgi:hypothetical protein
MDPMAAPGDVHHYHENGLKVLLSDARNVRDLLALAGVKLAARLDVDRAELKSQTFIKGDSRHIVADVLLRVPIRHDTASVGAAPWCWVYILIEHQQRPDSTMPLRLLDYVVQIYRQQAREWEGRHGPGAQPQYEPVLPVLFYTGERPWPGPGILADSLHRAEHFADVTPRLQPIFFSLHVTPRRHLHHNGGWFGHVLGLVADRRRSEQRFQRTLAAMIRTLETMPDDERGRRRDFLWFTFELVYNARGADEVPALAEIIRDSVATDERRRELDIMHRTAADVLRAEGEARGEARGQAQATIATAKATLFRQLQLRFGPVLSQTRSIIERTDDLDRLNLWLDRIVTAKTADELGIE